MKYINYFLIVFLLFSSCRDDKDFTPDVTLPSPILENYNPQIDIVNGTVFGTVIDEFENPVAEASVRLNGREYTTNASGNFIIQNESLDANGTFLTVQKSGFFEGSRRFYPRENSTNYITIQLLELNTIEVFEAINGGTVVGADGIELTFAANSIQASDGTLYTGSVSVAAKWLDPTSTNINNIMPGDLVGINSEIEEVSLVSYGMMAVELFGNSGEKLNLAPNNEATISFPIPSQLLNNAPQEIPLWSFEEQEFGIWIEEGTARLEGEKYVGQVSHFSFWNCDVPYDLVNVSGQLVSSTGIPIANANVVVTAVELNISRTGITDNEGFFSGKIPRNFTWTITANYGNSGVNCGFQALTFGPFSDTDPDFINLGPIGLDAIQIEEVTVMGSVVDCNNNPVTNGLVQFQVGMIQTAFYLDNTGSFETAILNCEMVDSIGIRGINLDELTTSSQSFKPVAPNIDFDTIKACEEELDFFTVFMLGDTVTLHSGVPGVGALVYAFNSDQIVAQASDLGILYIATLNETEVGVYTDIESYQGNQFQIVPPLTEMFPFFEYEQNATAFKLTISRNDNIVGGRIVGRIEGEGNFESSPTVDNLEDVEYIIEFNLIIF